MRTIQASESQVILQNLNPCSLYWVVVTAINCGLHIMSEPRLIELYEPAPLNITFCPGDRFICSDWINVDVMSKVASTENVLSSIITSQCPAGNLPCYRRSRFVCYVDSSMVTFE